MTREEYLTYVQETYQNYDKSVAKVMGGYEIFNDPCETFYEEYTQILGHFSEQGKPEELEYAPRDFYRKVTDLEKNFVKRLANWQGSIENKIKFSLKNKDVERYQQKIQQDFENISVELTRVQKIFPALDLQTIQQVFVTAQQELFATEPDTPDASHTTENESYLDFVKATYEKYDKSVAKVMGAYEIFNDPCAVFYEEYPQMLKRFVENGKPEALEYAPRDFYRKVIDLERNFIKRLSNWQSSIENKMNFSLKNKEVERYHEKIRQDFSNISIELERVQKIFPDLDLQLLRNKFLKTQQDLEQVLILGDKPDKVALNSQNESKSVSEVTAKTTVQDAGFGDRLTSLYKQFNEAVRVVKSGEIHDLTHVAFYRAYPAMLQEFNQNPLPDGLEYSLKNFYKEVLRLEEHYLKYQDARLRNFNHILEHVPQNFERSLIQTIGEVEKIKNHLNNAHLLFPHISFGGVKSKLAHCLDEYITPYQNQVWQSEFHKQHAGQLLFSQKPIIVGKEDAAQFSLNLDATKAIYAIYYGKGLIKDEVELPNVAQVDCSIEAYINGTRHEIYSLMSVDKLKQGVWLLDILPETASLAHNKTMVEEWAKVLSSLEKERKEVKLYIKLSRRNLIHKGVIFNLDCTQVESDRLLQNAKEITTELEKKELDEEAIKDQLEAERLAEEASKDIRNNVEYMQLLSEGANLANMIVSDTQNVGSQYFRINEVHKAAHQLIYAERLAAMNEYGKPDDISGQYNTEGAWFDDLTAFAGKMEENWQQHIKPQVLALFDRAYQEKSQSIKQALETLKMAYQLCEIMSSNFTIDDVEQQRQALEAASKELGGAYGIVTSKGFNLENAGKILLSDRLIAIGQEDVSSFKSELKVNEQPTAYLVAYVDKPIRYASYMMPEDYRPPALRLAYETDYQQEEVVLTAPYLDKKWLDQTFALITLLPDIQKDADSYVTIKIAEFLSNLSPRMHQVNFTLSGGMLNIYEKHNQQIDYDTEVKLANGLFKVDLTGVDTQALKNWVQQQKDKFEDNLALSRPLPELFGKENIPFDDENLSVENIETLIKEANPSWDIKQIKVLARPRQFVVTKHEITNKPTSKTAWGTIGVVYQLDDWCYYSDNVVIVADYVSEGNYTPWRLLGVYEQVKISCRNI
ncbi:hypothetical protein BKI52_06610 [marine bacterium AO1-C]|nr:hypothetical protein BKI52_06610 [marine bacterium AO1-C]